MFPVPKSTSINLRITQEFRDDLQKLADYRGLTLSSLAHSLLVKSVRWERQNEPEAFEGERKVSGKHSGIPVAPRSKKAIPLYTPKTTERRKAEDAPYKKKNKRVA
jgi:hypothetical protein